MSGGATPGVVSAEQLEVPQRSALRRRLLSLADSKRLLGLRYSDWLLGAPSIETGIAASGMAQDEWGHARLLYAMLKDLDDDPQALEHERDRHEYTSVDTLDHPFEDWADVVTAMVVVDGALTLALEGLAEGTYEPAGARIPKMVAEEAFHWDLGRAWCRRLGAGSPEARSRLAAAVEKLVPRTLAWLAPHDETHELLAQRGLCPHAADLETAYTERVAAVLSGAGIESLPDADRSDWDPARGRGPGAPDEDAVARARGDLNRALFVE